MGRKQSRPRQICYQCADREQLIGYFKFVYCDVELHPKIKRLHRGWFLLIDTVKGLMDFIEKRSRGLVHQYIATKDVVQKRTHFYSNEQYAIHETLLHSPRRLTCIDDIRILADKFLPTYIQMFQREGSLLVNKNMGCRPIGGRFRILKEDVRDSLVFPEFTKDDIKVTKWPNGKHWYAKIGNEDVVNEDGNMKWNTYKRAYAMAEKFLIRLNGEGIQI